MTTAEREAYEERAAIMQHEAGMTKEEAEAAAMAEYKLSRLIDMQGQA